MYAAVMLIVAVGVAAVLKDDPGYEAGRSEISGKLVGLTEYQENRSSEASEVRTDGDESRAASVGRMLDAVGDGAADRKAPSASAPFDTRPGSVASDDAGDKKTEVKKADASERRQEERVRFFQKEQCGRGRPQTGGGLFRKSRTRTGIRRAAVFRGKRVGRQEAAI